MILNKKLENYWLILLSLPSWECGLKFGLSGGLKLFKGVAPFVGVWIEIRITNTQRRKYYVAPFVGVWIEIPTSSHTALCKSSLPSWECGLKSEDIDKSEGGFPVAPFVGVWIEILI